MKRPSAFQMFVHLAFLKIPVLRVRECARRAEDHGIALSYETLVSHHLAGGRVVSLVEGLVYAQQRGITISVMNAAARDLVSKFGSGISLTEHIQALERAGLRNLDGAPLDIEKLKNA